MKATVSLENSYEFTGSFELTKMLLFLVPAEKLLAPRVCILHLARERKER
jgi:hypothetical protein